MDLHGWFAVATLAVAVTLFISKWIPLEVTALSIPVALAVTGTLERPDQALVGFGNQAVIALGGIFLLGAGLKESGVATLLARLLQRLGGRSELRTILVIMFAVCVLSAFMSSAAAVAVFLPAVAVLGRRAGISVSRLLMPLAYASIMGGTLTLIGTTPNLILGYELQARTGEGLGMFQFALVGAPVALLGIIYMATIGWRLLPAASDMDRVRTSQDPEDVARSYGFAENLYCLGVVAESRVVGRTIRGVGLGSSYQLDLVLLHRPGSLGSGYIHPRPDLVLQPGDQLYVEGEVEAARRFSNQEVLQFDVAGPKSVQRILGRGLTFAEVTLSPHSPVLGQTLRELDFRMRYGLTVIAVWRRGAAVTSGVADLAFQLGDAFLVSGPPTKVQELAADPDYIVINGHTDSEDVRRAPLAIGILLLALLPPLLGWLPIAVSALASALLMVGTGCLSIAGARRAVDWKILFLLIGTIPLGLALEQQGVAQAMANTVFPPGADFAKPVVLLALFLIAAVLSTTSNNGATAVILAPVAAQVAPSMNLGIGETFLAVAYGTSCAFVLPFAHQCNLMVMSPGGYRTRDYVRVGTGLSIVVAAATVLLLSVI